MKPILTVLTLVLVTMTATTALATEHNHRKLCGQDLSPFSGELSVRKSGAHLNIQLDLQSNRMNKIPVTIELFNSKTKTVLKNAEVHEIVLGEATPSNTLSWHLETDGTPNVEARVRFNDGISKGQLVIQDRPSVPQTIRLTEVKSINPIQLGQITFTKAVDLTPEK